MTCVSTFRCKPHDINQYKYRIIILPLQVMRLLREYETFLTLTRIYSEGWIFERFRKIKRAVLPALYLLIPAQYYFAGLPRAHCIEAFLEIINAETMGNNR